MNNTNVHVYWWYVLYIVMFLLYGHGLTTTTMENVSSTPDVKSTTSSVDSTGSVSYTLNLFSQTSSMLRDNTMTTNVIHSFSSSLSLSILESYNQTLLATSTDQHNNLEITPTNVNKLASMSIADTKTVLPTMNNSEDSTIIEFITTESPSFSIIPSFTEQITTSGNIGTSLVDLSTISSFVTYINSQEKTSTSSFVLPSSTTWFSTGNTANSVNTTTLHVVSTTTTSTTNEPSIMTNLQSYNDGVVTTSFTYWFDSSSALSTSDMFSTTSTIQPLQTSSSELYLSSNSYTNHVSNDSTLITSSYSEPESSNSVYKQIPTPTSLQSSSNIIYSLGGSNTANPENTIVSSTTVEMSTTAKNSSTIKVTPFSDISSFMSTSYSLLRSSEFVSSQTSTSSFVLPSSTTWFSTGNTANSVNTTTLHVVSTTTSGNNSSTVVPVSANKESSTSDITPIIIGVVVGVVALCLLVILICLYIRRKKERQLAKRAQIYNTNGYKHLQRHMQADIKSTLSGNVNLSEHFPLEHRHDNEIFESEDRNNTPVRTSFVNDDDETTSGYTSAYSRPYSINVNDSNRDTLNLDTVISGLNSNIKDKNIKNRGSKHVYLNDRNSQLGVHAAQKSVKDNILKINANTNLRNIADTREDVDKSLNHLSNSYMKLDSDIDSSRPNSEYVYSTVNKATNNSKRKLHEKIRPGTENSVSMYDEYYCGDVGVKAQQDTRIETNKKSSKHPTAYNSANYYEDVGSSKIHGTTPNNIGGYHYSSLNEVVRKVTNPYSTLADITEVDNGRTKHAFLSSQLNNTSYMNVSDSGVSQHPALNHKTGKDAANERERTKGEMPSNKPYQINSSLYPSDDPVYYVLEKADEIK